MVMQKKSTAHERKHTGKQEEEFRALARRNRLLGLWAAEKIGITGDDAVAYAREIVATSLEKSGGEAAIGKILSDFSAKGVDIGREQITREMDRLLPVAKDQIAKEGPK